MARMAIGKWAWSGTATSAGVDLVRHLVEHLAEIFEARNVRIFPFEVRGVRRAHGDVAQRDHIDQAGAGDRLGVAVAHAATADEGDVHFLVRAENGGGEQGKGAGHGAGCAGCERGFAEVAS